MTTLTGFSQPSWAIFQPSPAPMPGSRDPRTYEIGAGELLGHERAAPTEPGDVGFLEHRDDAAGVERERPDDGDDTLLDRLAGAVGALVGFALVVARDDVERSAGDAAVGVDPLLVDLGRARDVRVRRQLRVDRGRHHHLDRLARGRGPPPLGLAAVGRLAAAPRSPASVAVAALAWRGVVAAADSPSVAAWSSPPRRGRRVDAASSSSSPPHAASEQREHGEPAERDARPPSDWMRP